jgi:hypothetical protein
MHRPQRVLSMDSAATSSSLAADVGDDIGGKHHSVFFFSIVYGDGVLKHPLCKPIYKDS